MSQEMTQHHFSPEAHQQNASGSSDLLSNSALDEASQLEKDKQLIKRKKKLNISSESFEQFYNAIADSCRLRFLQYQSHPLYVLLELLFDKCERATSGEEVPSSAAYDGDIQEFVRRHEASLNPIFIDNDEIDNLMVKAIQVLRIHLLELEKVNELCKDFCNRYITCLKGKMHSENLLRSDMSTYNETTVQMMHNNNPHHIASAPNSNIAVNQQGEFVRHGGSIYQVQMRDEQLLHSENGIDGSTPLSQVGVTTSPHTHYASQQLFAHSQQHMHNANDDGHSKKTAKRGVLPKHATETLRSWLFSHIVHPYPTEDEKRTLATQTNLTLLQVNNWFINARRRILQPMLDASNHDAGGSSSKSKKSKMQSNRPTERFWPNSIASTNNSESHSVEEDAGTLLSNQIASTAQQSLSERCQHPQLSVESYHDPASELEPQQSAQLHHYRSDVAVTSHGQVSLNVVKN